MTNYSTWDQKAEALVKQVEDEEKHDKETNDVALGLTGGPQGPPTVVAKQQRQEMGVHSESRRNFISEQQAKEVSFTHENVVEPIVLSAAVVASRCVRLQNSRDVSYEFPAGGDMIKLFVESCRNVKISLGGAIVTSFVEINYCSNVELRAARPIATVQCDECTESPVRVIFADSENVGSFFHQNSPALEVGIQGQEFQMIGVAGPRQVITRLSQSDKLLSEDVVRGEKEFPLNLSMATSDAGRSGSMPEPEREDPTAKAEAKREDGNAAFKANDFLQAAVYYTEAIAMCGTLHLAWANRAQCLLMSGQPRKALEDAVRCTELAPDYAKGWFRKGIALHALQQYGAAVPALAEAEKLDPRNPQIPEAIRMAQLMCRTHGPGEGS